MKTNLDLESILNKSVVQKKKKKPKNQQQKQQLPKRSKFEHWLAIKESQWHDDEYDAGKDW